MWAWMLVLRLLLSFATHGRNGAVGSLRLGIVSNAGFQVDGDSFIRRMGSSLRSSFGSGSGNRLGGGLDMGLDAGFLTTTVAPLLSSCSAWNRLIPSLPRHIRRIGSSLRSSFGSGSGSGDRRGGGLDVGLDAGFLTTAAAPLLSSCSAWNRLIPILLRRRQRST